MQAEGTAHIEEAKQVNRQRPGSLQQLALRRVHVQGDIRSRPGGHSQSCRGVIDQRPIRRRVVDLHRQARGRHDQAADARKRNAAARRQQGDPLPGRIRKYGQSKVDVGQGQPKSVRRSTVQPGKSHDIIPANRQQIDRQTGSVRKRHRRGGFFDCKTTADREKVK